MRKHGALPATQPATTPVATPEIPDSWDDDVEEPIKDEPRNLAAKAFPDRGVTKPVGPEVVLKDEPSRKFSRKPAANALPDREVTKPAGSAVKETAAVKVKPAIERRYWGKIRWARGSLGWVTSDSVRTDRTVNPQGYSLTEITNAIFLHKTDCQGFFPRQGMDVSFRVEPDNQGKLKCVDVKQQEEKSMMTWDEWTQPKHKPKANAVVPVPQSVDKRVDSNPTISNEQPLKAAVAKQVRDISSDDRFAELGKARSKARDKALMQSRLTHSKLKALTQKLDQSSLTPSNSKVHKQNSDCGSSTDAGPTSCSASLTSSRPSVARLPRTKVAIPRSSWNDVSILRVSRYEEVEDSDEEPQLEKVVPHQPGIAESWEDEVDCWDEPPLAGQGEEKAMSWADEVDSSGCNLGLGDTKMVEDRSKTAILRVGDQIGKKTAHGLSQKRLLNRKLVKRTLDVGIADASAPASEPKAATAHSSSQKRLVNRKLVKRTPIAEVADVRASTSESIAEHELAQFCRDMGPCFPFEFVARHLGTDFDAIIQLASDVHSLDSLVQAGMKPLHRNKFCRALRLEKERRAK
jgi:hypothetical protein